MSGPESARTRFVVGALLVAAALWWTQAHLDTIDKPFATQKAALHEAILANEAPDPYQYKGWALSHAVAFAARSTGVEPTRWFESLVLAGLLALVFAHHAWLRTWFGTRDALVGGLLLVALGHILLRGWHHHPQEFLGVAGHCLLLRAIARDASVLAVAAAMLVLGLIWEKHVVLAPLTGLFWLVRGRGVLRAQGVALLYGVAALAVPIAIRLHLGADRAHVDGDSPWWAQDEWSILARQVPFVLPFVVCLFLAWRQLPTWVRVLWLSLPIAVAAYVSQQFILHEVRSFFLLVPVFTATAVAALVPQGNRAPSLSGAEAS